MIKTSSKKYETVKEIRERESKAAEVKLRELCEKLAIERHGEKTIKQWSNENKGLWYLPVLGEDGSIEKMAVMRPINRAILSFASTKITDEGLYAFLEQCMRECMIAGDNEILDDDDYFIPSAMKFNAILEGKKAALLKR